MSVIVSKFTYVYCLSRNEKNNITVLFVSQCRRRKIRLVKSFGFRHFGLSLSMQKCQTFVIKPTQHYFETLSKDDLKTLA